ncbi:MAG: hypothetical protein ACYCZ2_19340 [Lutibacter sp.]|nr:MAG: hypothetical protein APF83_10940 [Lutibacter sp. BRH_c52]
MTKKTNKLKWVAVGLAIIQGFNGLSAVVGGFKLMNDPSGMDIGMELEWLQTTPFINYLIPGIVLFFLNGLGNFAGFWFTVKKKALAGKIGAVFGAVMVVWILFQVFWIGYKSFLQPLYFGTGLIQLLFGLYLMRITEKLNL